MALQIKKLNHSEYGVKMRATIQQTGRFSFTEATAKNLHLTDKTRFAIYQDQQKKDILYLVANDEDPEAFPVKRTGMYYYMATTTLFTMLHYDFENITYIFDIYRMPEADEETGGATYRLVRREIPKNAPVEDDEE